MTVLGVAIAMFIGWIIGFAVFDIRIFAIYILLIIGLVYLATYLVILRKPEPH